MASDFNKPVAGDAYTVILPNLVVVLQDLARGLEPTLTGTSTNVPVGALRWNASVNYDERFNGTSWVPKTALYAINISGNAGTVTNGIYTTNIGTYAPSLSGVGATGTWNISVSGSAGSLSGTLGVAGGGTGATTAAGALNALGAAPTANPVFTGSVKETKNVMAANNIDLNAGGFFTKTIAGATALTISNVPAAGTVASFILELTNGGSANITWWAAIKWASGITPVLTAAGRDVLGFFTHDGGTTWTGIVLGRDVR